LLNFNRSTFHGSLPLKGTVSILEFIEAGHTWKVFHDHDIVLAGRC